MNRFVELTAIDLDKETRWLRELARQQAEASEGRAVNFRDVDFSEDDLERPIAQSEEAPAPDADTDLSNPPEGVYTSILVFENDIRELYPRRGDRQGTRIVYRSGAARPVKESYAEVKAAFAALANQPGVAHD